MADSVLMQSIKLGPQCLTLIELFLYSTILKIILKK